MVMNINGGGYTPLDKTAAHSSKSSTENAATPAPAIKQSESKSSSASSDAVKLTALPDTKASSAPVDQQRVAALSSAIADGSYHVDAEQLASDIIELESDIFGS